MNENRARPSLNNANVDVIPVHGVIVNLVAPAAAPPAVALRSVIANYHSDHRIMSEHEPCPVISI